MELEWCEKSQKNTIFSSFYNIWGENDEVDEVNRILPENRESREILNKSWSWLKKNSPDKHQIKQLSSKMLYKSHE